MRKINLLLAWIIVFLFSPAAFGASPFDVHKGPFGVKIRGLQLGRPLSFEELAAIGEQFSQYSISLGKKGKTDVVMINSELTKAGSWTWDIVYGDASSNALAAHVKNLGELLEGLKKRGLDSAKLFLYDGSVIITEKNRIIKIFFSREAFKAEFMDLDVFAEAIARNIPSITNMNWDQVTQAYYHKNYSEGWQITVNKDGVHIDPITI